ncbi:MAG TPA: serine hydrolase domain-containing protein [Cellvibrio sp.]|nr:serine hydrolase domain-containing protein [Cellvibrio sp.]
MRSIPYKKISLVIFVAGFIWFVWPIYQFLAYEGKVPMWFPTDIKAPGYYPQTTAFPTHQQSAAALALLAQHRATIHAPAISAAVAIDGKITWAGAVGWANIETRQPATADTRFRIGSTSKAVTATLLARMVQEGKIELDKPISIYLELLPNPEWATLTPRQLASHTSGIPDYVDNYGDLPGLYYLFKLDKRYTSVSESLEVFDGTSLLFKPGTRYHYSSFNTVLQSRVLEAAAGEAFLNALQHQVFIPLKMEATAAEYELDEHAPLAIFYWNQDGNHPAYRIWQPVDLSHRLAGGGFTSTPSDMVKLGSAWLDNNFITPETRQLFWTPQTLADGSINESNYALGWRWANYEDAQGKIHNANHGGVSRGSQSWLMVIPDRRMVVAVMINSNVENFWDFGQVSMPLARLFFATR